MSRDPYYDDKDIMPDWDDMSLDWLDDLKPKKPSAQEPASRPKAQEPWREQPSRAGGTARRSVEPSEYSRREPARPSREQESRQTRPAAGGRTAENRQAAGSRTPERMSRQPAERRPARSGSGSRASEYERSQHAAPPRRTVKAGEPEYRQGRRRRSSAPLIILIVVLVLGMGFAGWKLGSIFLNYSRDRSAYNDLAAQAISGLAEGEEQTVAVEGEEDDTEVSTVSEVPFTVDWDYLKGINSNVVGWLYCANTVINYPVVQTNDHEYYLSHGFDGSSNTSGTLFADMNSVEGITQSNYIIYGHNMKDNSMFGTFQNYVNYSYYESYPTLYYLTPDANYRIDLFCAHIVEATDDNYPGYFSSISDYQAYLNKVTSSAFWVNYDVVSTDYQLITLSTCTSAAGYSDPRLLVQGMLVPIE